MQSLEHLSNQKVFTELKDRGIVKVPLVYVPIFKCREICVRNVKVFTSLENANIYIKEKFFKKYFDRQYFNGCVVYESFDDLDEEEKEEVSYCLESCFVSIYTLDPTLSYNKIYVIYYPDCDDSKAVIIVYVGNDKKIYDSFKDEKRFKRKKFLI